MILYRPHKGGLKEAMNELQEFENEEKMLNFICNDTNKFLDLKFIIEPCDLLIKMYGNEPDNRIGWNKTFSITFKAYEDVKNKESYLYWTNGVKYNHPCVVFGFCTDDFQENWNEIYNNFLTNHK